MRVRLTKPDDRDALISLFAGAELRSGREAISEHKALRVLDPAVIDVVADDGGEIEAYGQAAWHGGGAEPHWAIEAVASGAGARSWRVVVEALVSAVPSTRSHVVWVTRESELAAALDLGFVVDRSIRELRRRLPITGGPSLPAGIAIAPLRVGRDEQAWLDVHNAAFAGHPEVGGMTHDELALRMGQDWFDPDGLLLAWRGDRLIGSCWTKLHPGGVGEIYLIGLSPDGQGAGVGSPLVVAGLRDLADRQGASEAMLYVDDRNTRALSLYERLGFVERYVVRRLSPAPRRAHA